LAGLIYTIGSYFFPFFPSLVFKDVFETFSIPLFKIPYPVLDEWLSVDGILNWKKAFATKPGFSSLAVAITWLMISMAFGFLHYSAMSMKRWPGIIFMSLILIFFGTLPYEEAGILFPELKWPLFLVLFFSFPILLAGKLQKTVGNGPLIWALPFILFYALLFSSMFLFSSAGYPSFFILQISTPGLLIGGILFILMVAHEPLHGLARLTSQKGSLRNNGLAHFSIFSLLYLGNLLIFYLSNSTTLLLESTGIEPVYFILLSGGIGFFLFGKLAENLGFWKNIKGADSFFTSFALLLLSGVSWSFQNSNDAYFDVLRDIILFTHLGIGFLFAIYTALNFANIYASKVGFEKVLLKGRSFPLFMVWIGGLVIVILLFLRSGKFQLYQAQGAYFASLAQAYDQEGENSFARVFYERSSGFAYRNHKALYALAWDELEKNRRAKAMNFLDQAKLKKSRPEDYVLAAWILAESKAPFDEIFRLNKGFRIHPFSSHISNNLGLAFKEINILDSSLIYFSMSGPEGRENVKALVIKQVGEIPENIGQGFDQLNPNDWLLAFRAQVLPMKKSTSEKQSFPAYYNESLFRSVKKGMKPVNFPDTIMGSQDLNQANIKLLQSLYFLNQGLLDSASIMISEASKEGLTNQSYFNQFAARAFFSLKAYHWAEPYLKQLVEKGNKEYLSMFLFALIENGKTAEAKNLLPTLIREYPAVYFQFTNDGLAEDESRKRYLDLNRYIHVCIDSGLSYKRYISLLSDINDPSIKALAIRNIPKKQYGPLPYDSLNSLSLRLGISFEGDLREELGLSLLYRGDTSAFIELIKNSKEGSNLFPLVNSFYSQSQGDLNEAFFAAQRSYVLMPWIDATVTNLAGLWIELDKVEMAYNLLLDHINRFGRSPKNSKAMASTSLYFGIESNMEYELDWLKENMKEGEWIKTREELEALRTRLQSWE
jgi:hypothetical protein